MPPVRETRPQPTARHSRTRNPGRDGAYAQRQLAGLSALIALAEPEITVIPFSGPAVAMRYTGPIERVYERPLEPPPRVRTTDRPSATTTVRRTDRMMRNAIYIILNSGVQAALGFGFWVITARFFSTSDVGRASSLISATTLLAFLGLLGLNTTFIRYLPIAPSRNRLLTAGITAVALCSAVAAACYIFLTPRLAPSVAFVAHSLPMALGFALLTATSAVNVLTDSVFIAAGKSSYNAVVDGVVGGTVRIALVAATAGGGAYAIFGASSSGYFTATIVSLVLMGRVLKWRPNFRSPWQALRPVLRFSGANYIGNILNLLPGLVIPLIVLNRIGASTEAYYYVAFQLASVVYTATSAVEQAFLAEGARNGRMDRTVLIRSLRLLLMFSVPAFLATLALGHFALLAFGTQYSEHAEGALIALASAVLPLAANNWFLTVLRLANQLSTIVWSNLVYGVAIIGLAWVLAPHGVTALSLAWPIGVSAGAVVAGVPALAAIRRKRSDPYQRGRRA